MRSLILLFIFSIVIVTLPSVRADVEPDDLGKAIKRSGKAAEVFREIMDVPEKAIPDYVIERAECIAVFPSVLNFGFIFGGRGGTGLVTIRDPHTRQWQAPIYLKLGGGSFGAQIGGQSIDLVLVGMNRRAADMFVKERFELGGELSAAAGPVGRNAAASTDLPTIRSQFLSYSRSRGLFAGAVIKGTVIKQDKDLNEAVYGQRKLDTFQPVSERRIPAGVMNFTNTVKSYSGRPRA